MKYLIIGADHNGFSLKEKLKVFLRKNKVNFVDVGNHSFDKDDDYVDFASKAARLVQHGNRAVLMCGSGIGMCIAANKFRGVYAALANDVKTAKISRVHNDSNVLCLGVVSFDKASKIVKAWLGAKFSESARHRRRINKIKKIEKGI